MLKIVLSRTGKSKKPYYRILVNESTRDPWGKFLENIGNYDPRAKKLVIKADRVKKYIADGAQLSTTLHNLLVTKGVIEGKKKSVTHISVRRAKKLADKKAKEVAAVPAA